MPARTHISGSIVALVTPMDASGAIDFQALDALLEWHIEQGTDAIVSVGTTGESATLTVAEHMAVIRRTNATVAGRIPVIAGTGANSTAEAIALTREAESIGVDACLLVTPYYNKPSQEGLFRHYAAIAQATSGSLILYNVPGRTGCDMQPETVARLLEFERIVGIKEALGEQARIEDLVALDSDFVVLSGDDATARESMYRGCRGDISVTANVAPGAMHRMCAAAMAGERDTADGIDETLAALHRDLFLEPNPVPVKWALWRMGKIGEGLRLPLAPLNPTYHAAVEQALQLAGVDL